MASAWRVNCGIALKSGASRVVSNFIGGYSPLDNFEPSIPPFPDSTKKLALWTEKSGFALPNANVMLTKL
jgi:hypothetical protein